MLYSCGWSPMSLFVAREREGGDWLEDDELDDDDEEEEFKNVRIA